ncbi:MAG: glycerol-3-phosphate dehydrogenase/oxidase [Flavobacteriales bacterium]|nr:glycerol-3-phosphate dehydrogenase/oxidase [Flavobacteriales bacterium]
MIAYTKAGRKPLNAVCNGSIMNRDVAIERMKSTGVDLVVIGGGITGCGIALDAVSRGLSVALVEREDFASGTSSRSTKLIHGGLRYLKQWDFKLVNEVGRERAIVHKIAPHLVHPDKMLLPLVKDGKYGYWLTNVGLTVYDLLAGVNGDDRRQMLNKKETSELEPLLRDDILEGGGFYAEYRTDDARLVMSVLKSAVDEGATAANYCEVVDYRIKKDKIRGVRVKDVLSQEEFTIKSKLVVNATGPWVDQLRAKADALHGKKLFLSKGVHLVVSRNRFPINNTVYFDNEDGRMLFAVPRINKVYLGTTDTAYSEDIASPQTSAEDVDYVLKAVNHMFPSIQLQVQDVESTWAGLRPLIFEEGKGASEMSRKDETFEAHNGLISIAGGKLTGYRKMAERIIDLVFDRLERDNPGCTTDQITLHGGEFQDYAAVEKAVKKLTKEGMKQDMATYLVHNYGSSVGLLLHDVKSFETKDILKAELIYGIEHEMVIRANDFLERRTGRLNFDIECVKKFYPKVIQWMAKRLSWDEERIQEEKKTVESKLDEVTSMLS